ncbi:MAG: phosphodiester glycosidase family protein [Candidatus Cryptobacteroides sp.]|nr:phosphodiester glycosidase family protein [Rikenellaceae bacterium]MDY4563318.1 phosphodiester glycosidase family protein [Candidatus Cryptobacteroides sp.]
MRMIITNLFAILALCSISCSKANNDQYIPENSMPGADSGVEDVEASPGHKEGDWMVYDVDEGLTYMVFNDFDDVSGANQIVNVCKIDLNSGKYSVNMNFVDSGNITSTILKGRNAIVCTNGGFNIEAVYIKKDGTVYHDIEWEYFDSANTIQNWMNEAAVYFDGNQGVVIENECEGMPIAQTKSHYANDDRKTFVGSSPMLIKDFEKVGSTYIYRNGYKDGTDLSSYHPSSSVVHSANRHPRTIIALTQDNYLILMTVDGRWPGKAEGMTAKEMTEFIAKHFNPQYALSLDGGGSTTMCVRGYGDKETYCVNYPTDNGKFDHKGERKVPTHIYVTKN